MRDGRDPLVLFVSLDSTGLRNVGLEFNEISEALDFLPEGSGMRATPLFQPTIRKLGEELARRSPTVLHLAGHGRERSLLLKDEGENTVALKADHLGEILGRVKLDLLFVSACHSGSLAEGLSGPVECVVCYPGPVDDRYAMQLARSFYRHAARGVTVADALDLACADNRDLLDTGLGRKPPRLVGNGEVRIFPAAAARGPRPPLRIALLLNGSAHYVNSIQYGFRSAVRERLDPAFELVSQQRQGQPEEAHLEENRALVLELVESFGPEPPDYVVTVGTAVTQAAVAALPNVYKIVFLGVSDPEQAGILDRAPAPGSGAFVAGVRYGLPIRETVGIIRGCFPGRIPVFVHSGRRYPQDTHLLRELEPLREDGSVELLDLEGVGEIGRWRDRIFFGRFFLCGRMGEFVRANPRAAFVGVSPENVRLGAVMAIGCDTERIGELGARKIVVPDALKQAAIPNGTVLEPEDRVVVASRKRLQACGLSLGPGCPENLTWYEA